MYFLFFIFCICSFVETVERKTATRERKEEWRDLGIEDQRERGKNVRKRAVELNSHQAERG